MTLLAPGFLAAAAVAALAVVALHLLSYQRPRPRPLPTARFLPDRPVRAVASVRRPTDLVLLAVRTLALLLIGAAFARPVRAPAAGAVARIFLVDRSRAVADPAEARDSVRRLARAADVVVAFDSAAARPVSVGSGSPPAVELPPTVPVRGSVSAALAAAGRAARLVRARADSVELVLVSPLLREEIDDATLAIRRAWPGRVRVVPVAARAAGDDTLPLALELTTAATTEPAGADPLGATVALAGRAATGGGNARIVRGQAAAADSTWVAAGNGRRLVIWPPAGVPNDWQPRPRPDSVGGLIAEGAALVVAPFLRVAGPPSSTAGPAARVSARWVDGEPAAIERQLGGGCVREVAVAVPTAGDLAIAPSFARFVRALAGPCGGHRDAAPAPAAVRTALAGAGPLARASALGGAPGDVDSPFARWLLVAAALLLLAEPIARRIGGAREGAA